MVISMAKVRLAHASFLGQKIQKLAQAACVRHACLRAPCVAWQLFSPSFSLSFFLFLSLFSTSFAFNPLRGISRVKICFPQYFGKPRRYTQKKNIFVGNEKTDFLAFFFYFLRPAFGHPQSLEYFFLKPK